MTRLLAGRSGPQLCDDGKEPTAVVAPPEAIVPQRARIAVATFLLCMGVASAGWATRLPSIKASLHLGAGGLGLALTGAPVGFVVASAIAPALVRRFTSRTTARGALLGTSLAVLIPALAWNGVSLAIGLIGLGLAFGVSDIAVNVQAVAVERLYGRPVMAGMHAMWSVGLVVGSLVGAGAAGAGISPRAEFTALAVVLVVISAYVGRWLLKPAAEGIEPKSARPAAPPVRFRQQPVLIIVGVVALCGYLTEGSVSDWGGVYLHGHQHASLAVAALAVFVFSLGQVAGRLAGDRITARWGRVDTIWRSALLAAAGMFVVVVATSPTPALVGYGILGVGGATIVPNAFSIAGTVAGTSPARLLSRVTALGYAGSFLGPPAIGLVAQATGLTVALAIPASLMLLVVPLAARLRRELDPADDGRDRKAGHAGPSPT